MAIGIPEVDENILHGLFDGDDGLFVSVLSSFTAKTPEVLQKLQNVSKDTLPDYVNNIHKLKGACANICAEEARKTALKLETMARNGDLTGVLAENGTFLKYMEDLMGNLQNWLKNRQKGA